MASSSSKDAQIALLLSGYRNPGLLVSELRELLQAYPGLRCRRTAFGPGRDLACLEGVLTPDSVPVVLWVLENYPDAPPVCFVRPGPGAQVRPSASVNPAGHITMPYVKAWRSDSRLRELLRLMEEHFTKEPPFESTGDSKPKPYSTGAQPSSPPTGSYGPAPSSRQSPVSFKLAQPSSQPLAQYTSAQPSSQPPTAQYSPAQPSSHPPASYKPAQPSSQPASKYTPAPPSRPSPVSYKPAQPSSQLTTQYSPTQQSSQPPASYKPAQLSSQPATQYSPAQPSSQPPASYKSSTPSSQPTSKYIPAPPSRPSSVSYSPAQPSSQPATQYSPGQQSSQPPASYNPAPPSSQTAPQYSPVQPSNQSPASYKPAQPSSQPASQYNPAQPPSQPSASYIPAQPSSQPTTHYSPAQKSNQPPASYKSAQPSSQPTTQYNPAQKSSQTPASYNPVQPSSQLTSQYSPAQTSSQPTSQYIHPQPSSQPSASYNSAQPSNQPQAYNSTPSAYNPAPPSPVYKPQTTPGYNLPGTPYISSAVFAASQALSTPYSNVSPPYQVPAQESTDPRRRALDALLSKMSGLLRDTLSREGAACQYQREFHETLNARKSRLDAATRLLSDDCVRMSAVVNYLRVKSEELRAACDEYTTKWPTIDAVVEPPNPLYKQLLSVYAEEQALEDATYDLTEAFHREPHLESYLRNIRNLSSRKFYLVALMQKIRLQAGLPI